MDSVVDTSRWGSSPFQKGELTVILRPGSEETLGPLGPLVRVFYGGQQVHGLQSIRVFADVARTFPSIELGTTGIMLEDAKYSGERFCTLLSKGDIVVSVKNFMSHDKMVPAYTHNVLVRYLRDDSDMDFGGCLGMIQSVELIADVSSAKIVLTYLDIHSPSAVGKIAIQSSESRRTNTQETIARLQQIPYVEVRFRDSGIELSRPLEG